MGNQQSIPAENTDQQLDRVPSEEMRKLETQQQIALAKLKTEKEMEANQNASDVQAYNELLDSVRREQQQKEITQRSNMFFSTAVSISVLFISIILIVIYVYNSQSKSNISTSDIPTSNISTSDIATSDIPTSNISTK